MSSAKGMMGGIVCGKCGGSGACGKRNPPCYGTGWESTVGNWHIPDYTQGEMPPEALAIAIGIAVAVTRTGG